MDEASYTDFDVPLEHGGDDGSGAYDLGSSRSLEARTAAAKALIDPLTKSILWEHLPKSDRNYCFGSEVLPHLSRSVKIRILMEHRMALGGAGYCRKLDRGVARMLESELSYALTLWENSGDFADLCKDRNPRNNVASKDFVDDSVISQWLVHYRKFCDKQNKKLGRVGINLANVPYTAGPSEIKTAVEDLLAWPGAVAAIDPWWKKDLWEHDGTVTVYVPKVAAEDLLQKCEKQQLSISSRGNRSTRVIKAWIARGYRGESGREEAKPSQW